MSDQEVKTPSDTPFIDHLVMRDLWADRLSTAPYTREFVTDSPVLRRVREQFTSYAHASCIRSQTLTAIPPWSLRCICFVYTVIDVDGDPPVKSPLAQLMSPRSPKPTGSCMTQKVLFLLYDSKFLFSTKSSRDIKIILNFSNVYGNFHVNIHFFHFTQE